MQEDHTPRWIKKLRRRLEIKCEKGDIVPLEDFRVFGTQAMFQHDLLKSWVCLGQHIFGDDIFPPKYIPTVMDENWVELEESEDGGESYQSLD